jgi:hypothetical protein
VWSGQAPVLAGTLRAGASAGPAVLHSPSPGGLVGAFSPSQGLLRERTFRTATGSLQGVLRPSQVSWLCSPTCLSDGTHLWSFTDK